MNFSLTLLLTFCFFSAMYYRSATRYLKLVLNSDDLDVLMKRITVMPLLIGSSTSEKYLEQSSVKALRIVAIIVEILSVLGIMDFYSWWGALLAILFGGGLATIKKMHIDLIDRQINQARFFLIISIVIIVGIVTFVPNM